MSIPPAPATPLQPEATKAPGREMPNILPAIVIVTVMWLVHVWASTGDAAAQRFFPGKIIAPAICALLMVGWWCWANRSRLGQVIFDVAVILIVAIVTIVVAGKNFPALGLILYALPTICTLWVAWLIVSARFSWSLRRLGVLGLWGVAGLIYSLLRIDGMGGDFRADVNWRWTPTAESKLLAELDSTSGSNAAKEIEASKELVVQQGDWPEFRGPNRDGRVTGVRIRTDWEQSPPKELWRHRIGPAWSSCSVVGDHLYTQEQRGEEELVVCYHTESGKEIWKHSDHTRFEEVVAGPGPRGTPTFHEGRIYSLGANGTLNCLNATTGERLWQADILKDSKLEKPKPPQWGFASSPLVLEDTVSVFAGAPDGKGVLAYHIESGKPAWSGLHSRNHNVMSSYSSPQAIKIRGHFEILIATNEGLTSLGTGNGETRWDHLWPVEQARIVQPFALSDSEFLLGTGLTGGGLRKIQLYLDPKDEIWLTREIWTAKNCKPYFNDFVVFNDHIYAFDSNSSGTILMCLDLEDGSMKWRARGYGFGQMLLLTEDAQLLILTDTGDVALVAAKPDGHEELARFKAIQGKTWNHPVVANGKLFVRNSEEIACFLIGLDTEPKPHQSADASSLTPSESDPPKEKAE